MTVSQQFQDFRSNYLIPSNMVSSILDRYGRITRRLNIEFWSTESSTSHSLYVGSYGRDTAAKGVSDLDVYFQLPKSVYDQYNGRINGQSAMLQAVRTALQKTYTSSSIRGDGQVVVISFNDGVTFEILPGFNNNDVSITFADSNDGGSWKVCNPGAEMASFARRNRESNHNLKAICRMMRIWKAECDVPITGMLIDTLAYNFIENWEHKEKSFLYHDFLVRDFLYFLTQCDRAQDWWRAPGSNSWVRRTGVFERKAILAFTSATEAIQHQRSGQHWSSVQAWRRVFGASFPS